MCNECSTEDLAWTRLSSTNLAWLCPLMSVLGEVLAAKKMD
jgi:hypothetical protein